jgi:hypothetical protein
MTSVDVSDATWVPSLTMTTVASATALVCTQPVFAGLIALSLDAWRPSEHGSYRRVVNPRQTRRHTCCRAQLTTELAVHSPGHAKRPAEPGRRADAGVSPNLARPVAFLAQGLVPLCEALARRWYASRQAVTGRIG